MSDECRVCKISGKGHYCHGDDEVSESKLTDLLSVSVGLHKNRMKSNLSAMERIFVCEWHKMNNDFPGTTNILDCLFQMSCDENDPDCIDRFTSGGLGYHKHTELGPLTERDKIVAETVIQWLGTNVGRGFLHNCGFTR